MAAGPYFTHFVSDPILFPTPGSSPDVPARTPMVIAATIGVTCLFLHSIMQPFPSSFSLSQRLWFPTTPRSPVNTRTKIDGSEDPSLQTSSLNFCFLQVITSRIN